LQEVESIQDMTGMLMEEDGRPSEELRCVLAVVRHGDRTPKQKIKIKVTQVRNRKIAMCNSSSSTTNTSVLLKHFVVCERHFDEVSLRTCFTLWQHRSWVNLS
jgi:hypothetical protein